MHDTARLTAQTFFDTYGSKGQSILDVGSLDVNGTLRDLIPSDCKYTGMDTSAGPNVDVVLDDPYIFPFTCNEFDLVISSSCLEHDKFFWSTFTEMVRVSKPTGYTYISVPMFSGLHRHPVDCWRFFPDAGLALEDWARRFHPDVRLLESFILPPASEQHWDFVAVFGRPPSRHMASLFPTAQQIQGL